MVNARFTGTHYRTLDSKGRVLFPPGFLAAISAAAEAGSVSPSCWLTTLYGRITGYLPENWHTMVEQLCQIQNPSLRLSNFKTRLIGMAEEVVPDSQGRMRIPLSLRRAGHLVKDIVFVGILDKFEIWDQAMFEAVPNEDVSEELAACNIHIKL